MKPKERGRVRDERAPPHVRRLARLFFSFLLLIFKKRDVSRAFAEQTAASSRARDSGRVARAGGRRVDLHVGWLDLARCQPLLLYRQSLLRADARLPGVGNKKTTGRGRRV